MPREDFRSTDGEGAAYYARIFSDFDPPDDRPTRREAEMDEAACAEREPDRSEA